MAEEKKFFKKEGYLVIRPHEIEAAAFQWSEAKSVDVQRIEVLEYAHARVIEETKKLCGEISWPLPTWALPSKAPESESRAPFSDALNQRLAEVGERQRLDNSDKSTKNTPVFDSGSTTADGGGTSGEDIDKNAGARSKKRSIFG